MLYQRHCSLKNISGTPEDIWFSESEKDQYTASWCPQLQRFSVNPFVSTDIQNFGSMLDPVESLVRELDLPDESIVEPDTHADTPSPFEIRKDKPLSSLVDDMVSARMASMSEQLTSLQSMLTNFIASVDHTSPLPSRTSPAVVLQDDHVLQDVITSFQPFQTRPATEEVLQSATTIYLK